jgi:predicted flap endonuclease-1-like 5' DNA nuclease
MGDKVRVVNVSDRAATLGHKVLYPGEKRLVPHGILAQARKLYPDVFVATREEEIASEPEWEAEEIPEVAEVEEEMIPAGTIKGIGAKWAEKLASAGIHRVEDLAGLDDEGAAALIQDLGGVLNEEQLSDWVRQARELLGQAEYGG